MKTFPHIPPNRKSLAGRRPLYGVGVNDAPYQTQIKMGGKTLKCPYYSTWSKMMTRSYCPKYHATRPTYKGVTVCDPWHKFMGFREWMSQQKWEGMHLDKDIVIKGSRVYSPTTCAFVSRRVNGLMLYSKERTGDQPIGVHEDGGLFVAQCQNATGRQAYLGTYSTPGDARKACCEYKSGTIRDVARDQSDPRVEAALIKEAERLEREC